MILTSIITAFITSVITCLVAPFVTSYLERIVDTKKYRRERMNQWREYIESNWNKLDFRNTSCYAEIKPYLRENTIENVEGAVITIVSGRGGDTIKRFVLDDLVILEKKWKLLE